NQRTVTQLDNNSFPDMPFQWRGGWTAGAVYRAPVEPGLSARLPKPVTHDRDKNLLLRKPVRAVPSSTSLPDVRLTFNHLARRPPGGGREPSVRVRAGRRLLQRARADDVRLAVLSKDANSPRGLQLPPRQRTRPRDRRRHALCGPAAVARSRTVNQSGGRPGA